jgi:NAD(P)-dependent dehydrogenase (short-subunit alcohol dehydrogenase family)
MTGEARGTYVVTGATSGIGRCVAEGLVERGHDLIGVGRSADRCAETRRALESTSGSGRVSICRADLSLQNEVRGLAVEVSQLIDQWGETGLNGLVNNAATFTFWQTLTPEGFEMQWAVNHLAPFLLTHELLPSLKAAPAARVVTMSSGSHYRARLDWDDLQLQRHYNPLRAYGRTKLANVAFTAELNRRLGPGSSIRVFAADPGLVKTDIGAKTNSRLAGWIWALRRRGGIEPEQAAEGVLELLIGESVDVAKGLYWKHGKPKPPSPYALEPSVGRRLWQASSQMCGIDEGG